MKRFIPIALATGVLLADSSGGIRPRGSSSDYPAHQTAAGITVAAAVIPPDQVKKLFATDLNHAGYIVVEVAIFLDANASVPVTNGDFLLQLGADGTTVRAVTARSIGAILDAKNDSSRQRTISTRDIETTNTIGYESGRYDPNTGRRNGSGVYTGTGVGVGTGGRRNYPDPNAGGGTRVNEQELEDKALPEGDAIHEIAGYLYFPKPSGNKKANYELTFYGSSPRIHLSIPPAK